MILIPTSSDVFYTQITQLDGVDYLLDFRYNDRENSWRFSIALTDNTPLATGIKIVTNYPLLQKYADDRLPAGEIFCITSGDDSNPAQNDLGIGKRCLLVYYSKSEFPTGFEGWRGIVNIEAT